MSCFLTCSIRAMRVRPWSEPSSASMIASFSKVRSWTSGFLGSFYFCLVWLIWSSWMVSTWTCRFFLPLPPRVNLRLSGSSCFCIVSYGFYPKVGNSSFVIVRAWLFFCGMYSWVSYTFIEENGLLQSCCGLSLAYVCGGLGLASTEPNAGKSF